MAPVGPAGGRSPVPRAASSCAGLNSRGPRPAGAGGPVVTPITPGWPLIAPPHYSAGARDPPAVGEAGDPPVIR